MSNWKNRLNIYMEPLLLVFGLGVFSLIIPIVNDFSIKEGFCFFLFQVGGIIAPGMAFMLLLNLKKLSRMEFLALSYAVGYCLNIVMYYLFVPIGLKNYLTIGFVLLCFVSVVIIWKKGMQIEEYEEDKRGRIICFVFIVIVAMIELLTISTSNALPPRVSENVIFNDLMYWAGDSTSLAKGYPAFNFRKYPEYPYNYHFFSAMQMSVISLTTGIRVIFLCFGYTFIQPILLITMGSYIFFRRLTKRQILVIAAMFAVFFVEGCVDMTTITYTLHIMIAPFGFDVGMGLYLFFLWVLILQMSEEKFDWKLFLMSFLLFMATVGAKSPFGAMALVAMGISCIVWLFGKKYRKAFLYGIPILLGFLIMYIFVVNLKNSGQPETSLTQTFMQTPHIYNKMSNFLNVQHQKWLSLCPISLLKPIFEFFFAVFGMITSNYCVYIIFFFLAFVRAFILRKWKLFDTICVVIAFVGAIITMNWGNPDFSVAYFMMTTYMTSIAFSVKTVEDLLEEGTYFTKYRKVVLGGFCILLMSLGFMEALISDSGILNRAKRGFTALVSPQEITADSGARDYISADDYDACNWIRMNTTEDTVITGNKGLQLGRNESSRHTRVTGVFTERYTVRNDDSDALFYDLQYDKIPMLRKLGIEYILYNTTATQGFVLPKEYGEIVYWNETNVVYRLK